MKRQPFDWYAGWGWADCVGSIERMANAIERLDGWIERMAATIERSTSFIERNMTTIERSTK